MLNHIVGVWESNAFPKQWGEAKKTTGEEPRKIVGDCGEDEHKPQPKTKDQKDNEASGSKGKGKMVGDNDEKEEDLSEGLSSQESLVTKSLMNLSMLQRKLKLVKRRLVMHR